VKKLLIIVLLLAGCAHSQKSFTVEPAVISRVTVLFTRVNKELKVPIVVFLRNTQVVNAWTEGDRMDITLGALKFDDDTVSFIMAHELSHAKLKHSRNRKVLSGAITGIMIVVGSIIPGAGLLNHAINPAVVNNFSKENELEADKLASETCLNLGIPISKQVEIMNALRSLSGPGGGFWAQHPSWDDRISNVSTAPLP
jgi:Zn-dependent protease with chaperone function